MLKVAKVAPIRFLIFTQSTTIFNKKIILVRNLTVGERFYLTINCGCDEELLGGQVDEAAACPSETPSCFWNSYTDILSKQIIYYHFHENLCKSETVFIHIHESSTQCKELDGY